MVKSSVVHVQGTSDGVPVALGLAAATGLGLFAFTEVNAFILFVVVVVAAAMSCERTIFAVL